MMKTNNMRFLILAIVGIAITLIANPVNTYALPKNLETSELNPDGIEDTESDDQTSSSEDSDNSEDTESDDQTSSSEDSSQISQAKFADIKKTEPFFKKFDNTLQSNKALKFIPSDYTITVSFESVKVQNAHEGTFSGDGEYDLSAYVQGKKIVLTDPNAPGQGLWDVSDGETVTFNPPKKITVTVPKNLPLSIFTVGSEVDGCDRTSFPESIQSDIVSALSQGVNYLVKIGDIQDELNSAINWVGCKLNPNDEIGKINKIYESIDFGQGTHSDKSSSNDFIMKYTITAIPPKNPIGKFETSNPVLSRN